MDPGRISIVRRNSLNSKRNAIIRIGGRVWPLNTRGCRGIKLNRKRKHG